MQRTGVLPDARLPRDREELLAAVQVVAPVVTSAAAEADRAGRYPAHVIDALTAQRLFRLWIPRSLGGDELPLPASLEVFEAASRLDGAAGWLVTIGTGGGLFAAQFDEETAREIFGPPEALIAGSGAPCGTAVRSKDGYRVEGRWGYASGAHHATSFTANCVLD